MAGQCNIMSLIDRFQDIITFGIVRYRQMQILKEQLLGLVLLIHKEHITQKQLLTGVLQKQPLNKKPLPKYCCSRNVAKVLQKCI